MDLLARLTEHGELQDQSASNDRSWIVFWAEQNWMHRLSICTSIGSLWLCMHVKIYEHGMYEFAELRS